MGLQGVLYLTDTSAENGAFVCIPGFHKRLGGWLQTLPPSMEYQPEFSLQLEFRCLWHVTNRSDLKKMALPRVCRMFERLTENVEKAGLLSDTVDNNGKSVGNTLHIGAGADSFYEYMLKAHLQDGGRYDCAYRRFSVALDAIRRDLIRPWNSEISYLVRIQRDAPSRIVSRNMDHLDCFAPGMLALDYRISKKEDVLRDARHLMAGCWQLYNLSSTVGAESVQFGAKRLAIRNYANLLRPEVAESLYYMWKVTGDPVYQQWGWRMFRRFKRYSRFNGIYCTVSDIRRPRCTGKMESFWIAETLKYLFLLLEKDAINLDKWVFNTEAHPLPVVPSLPPCSCSS